ncbi:MAG: UbiA family prenyltransferase [Thaumarchaeota archaeon]|nr:UbiA family prenyltransferase [Nitrososphaerota archaeon]
MFSHRTDKLKLAKQSSVVRPTDASPAALTPLGHVRAFWTLMKSEYRVSVFVFSLITAYLLATNLKPNFVQLGELIVAWYFVTFGVYVFNSLTDVEEDRIDHPKRPIPSGRVSIKDGWIAFVTSIGVSFVVSFSISTICFILVLTSFVLGIAYSHPSIRAKRRFPLKILVSIPGAMVCSLCGGIVAQNLDGPVYFSAIFFGLFSLVTLLLGDISDVQGDTVAGVRSLPIVIGQRNSIFFVALLPMVIAFLGLAFFQAAHLNPLFPLIILAITTYSTLNIVTLLQKYDDHVFANKIKSRMRIIHFALQLSLILGLLVL